MQPLETYVSPRYLTCAETAKLVRGALKREFPGVKFSVRSSTYSGGASIHVGWTDGPTTKRVDAIAGRYAGADFDGMVDLKVYCQHWLEPNGIVKIAHREGTNGSLVEIIGDPPGPNAELVSFGSNFVFSNRKISDAWRDEIFAEFERVIGRPLVGDRNDMSFPWHQQVPLHVERFGENAGRLLHMVETDTDDLSSVFHQYTGARDRLAKP